MHNLAGVDEAGYGPTLGPLTVGLSWLQAPVGADLWQALAGTVARAPKRGSAALAVCDSKLLHKSGRPPVPLELTALAFVRLAFGRRPKTLRGLLKLLGATPPPRALPWYRGRLRVPQWSPLEALEEATAALLRGWRNQRLARLHLALRIVRADAFNAGVQHWGNKAQLHLWGVLELMQRVPRPFDVTVDRLGGRKHYAAALAEAFARLVQVEQESPDCSSYRLGPDDGVRFEVKADSRHFLVALSSILAKYVRELHMASLNRYFLARVPGLRPTAGYPQDARRFLAEIAGRVSEQECTSLVRGR